MLRQLLIALEIPDMVRFFGTPRGFLFAAIGAGLSVFLVLYPGQLLVRWLIDYTETIQHGLEHTNAAYFALRYLQNISGCVLDWHQAGLMPVGFDCQGHESMQIVPRHSWSGVFTLFVVIPFNLAKALLLTGLDAWQQAHLFGKLLLVVTSALSAWWLWRWIKPFSPQIDTDTIFALTVWVVLTPFLAGFIALALLGFLWALVAIFSKALAGLVFTGTIIHRAYAQAKSAFELSGGGGHPPSAGASTGEHGSG